MEAMKKLLLGGVAAVALSTAVGAVEMTPSTEGPPPPPAEAATPPNWLGVYGRTNSLAPSAESLMLGAPTVGSADGFLRSSQFGYNSQTGPFVLGLEADVRRKGGTDFIGSTGLDLSNFRNEQGWIGTLRPRAGVAADNWLIYGTGGLAYSSGDEARAGFSSTPSRTGWTVGGGVEYAPGKQWSLGLEYLYADFGKSPQSRSNFSTGGSPNEDHSQIVRGRLNYRFGWDGPQK
jgi:outer membrane immunogenic protein